MAEKFQRYEGPNGERFIRPYGTNDLIPVSDEDVAILNESGPEAFLNSMGNSIAQAALGTRILGNRVVGREEEGFEETLDEYRRAQELRGLDSRVAGFAGSVAPDVAIGAVTGGTGALVRRVGQTALSEAALGAIRNPEDPFTGAAIQGAIGGAVPFGGAMAGRTARGVVAGAERVAENPISRRVIDGIRRERTGMRVAELEGRVAGVADGTDETMGGAIRGDRVRRGVGAQANMRGDVSERPRVLEGMLTPAELDDMALELDLGDLATPGDRAALLARVDTGAIERADRIRETEELNRSNVVSDWASGGIDEIRSNQENAITRLVMNELGEGEGMRLTAANMNSLVGQTQNVFERAAEEAGDIPIANRRYAELQDIADEVGADDHGPVQRMIDNITKDAKDNADVLPNKLVRDYRTKLGRRAQSAAAAQNLERAAAFRDMQAWLDDLVDGRVGEETREALSEARYRWRIIRSLENSGATVNPEGNINLRSFITSYQRAGNRFYKSSARNEGRGRDFARKLETLAYLTHRVRPSSGTSERLMHNLMGRIPFTGR